MPAVDGPDLVAAGGEHGTDSSVQTYDERVKTTHQRARQRKLITVSPDSLPEAIEAQGGWSPVVAVAFKPTFTPALDDTDRVAVLTMADPQHRIGVGKATKPLGWSAGTSLVATCAGGRVTVSAAPRTSPAQQSVTLDSKGRLRLGSSAVAVLNADPGAQVLAIAVPATGELVLLPAAAALALLTGPLATTAPLPSREHEIGTEASARCGVRRRFQPEAVA
jgi:hypothetical protein